MLHRLGNEVPDSLCRLDKMVVRKMGIAHRRAGPTG